MTRLTPRQRHALVALADAGEHTATRLAATLRTHPQGAALTASSLVRRGLAHRIQDRGRVIYRITPRGLGHVRHDQLRLTVIAAGWGVVMALVIVGLPLALGRIR